MNDWVTQSLEYALTTWNDKIQEIWSLLTQSLETFRGGGIWSAINSIYGTTQAIGLALLVLFFVVGVVKTCSSMEEIKRPEQALKLFIRFAIAKVIITYGKDLMLSIFNIVQGITNNIMSSSGVGSIANSSLPSEIIEAISKCGFFDSIPLWAVTLIGILIIMVLSFILILTVYGRFFKLFLYTAIAPIPLSAVAGEPTQNIARSFIKSYIGVCMEGVIIILSCIIFSKFASSPPTLDGNLSAVSQVWTYLGELIFDMLVLVGTVKMADRVVKDMMGL